MSLIKCSECGHDVSTKAETCPHCGAPQEKQPASKQSNRPVILTPPSEKFVDDEARTAPEKKDVAVKQYSLGKLILIFFIGGFIYFLLTNDDSNTSTTYLVDPALDPQQQLDAIRANMRERNKTELERNRDGITSEIKYLIANGEYATAYRRAARFSKLNDDELKGLESEAWEKHRRKQEKLLLSKLKHIPASEFKANADEYAKLAELFPENERYKKKLNYYQGKQAGQNRETHVTTARSRYFFGANDMLISKCLKTDVVHTKAQAEALLEKEYGVNCDAIVDNEGTIIVTCEKDNFIKMAVVVAHTEAICNSMRNSTKAILEAD